MRLTTQIFINGDHAGDIWTNGRTVFSTDDPRVRMIVAEDEILDGETGKKITATSNPVGFVNSLCLHYKSMVMATKAKEE